MCTMEAGTRGTASVVVALTAGIEWAGPGPLIALYGTVPHTKEVCSPKCQQCPIGKRWT